MVSDTENDSNIYKKKNRNFYFCITYLLYFSKSIHWLIKRQNMFLSLLAQSTHVFLYI